MVNAQQILSVANRYAEQSPDQWKLVSELRALVETGADVTSRKEFRGHVTCGIIAMNGDGEVLLIHHKALDKWLTPGGHLEPEDSSLFDAALRELREEVQISRDQVTVPAHLLDIPVQLDRHSIPANAAKGEPEHEHWDFRFLVFVPGIEVRTELQLAEVVGADWKPLETLPVALAEAIRRCIPWRERLLA